MYRIFFYKKNSGVIPVKELLIELKNKNDKNSRINLKKISDTLNKMKICGLNVGMPNIRHLEDDIWEIRANSYRILFFVKNDEIVLLHYFIKKTNKTPLSEKQMARKEKERYLKEK